MASAGRVLAWPAWLGALTLLGPATPAQAALVATVTEPALDVEPCFGAGAGVPSPPSSLRWGVLAAAGLCWAVGGSTYYCWVGVRAFGNGATFQGVTFFAPLTCSEAACRAIPDTPSCGDD